MGSIDTNTIKQNYSIDEIVEKYLPLKKNGAEFEALCPFHKEKTPSFRVVPNKQFFHCFGCGANGDVIDFVADYQGISFRDACDVITGGKISPAVSPARRQSMCADVYEKYKPMLMPGDFALPKIGEKFTAINPKREHKLSTFTPLSVHPYHDLDGNLFGFIFRFEIDGKKITPAVRWCEFDGSQGWVMMSLGDDSRPLYGLNELKPTGQVVVVEGEKCRDHLQSVVGEKMSVVAWSGGTNTVKKSDWTPLSGRSVIIIPDNDEPGFNAARDANEIISNEIAHSVKTVIPDHELPKGWDVADRDWTMPEFIEWARDRIGYIPDQEPDECDNSEIIEYYTHEPEAKQEQNNVNPDEYYRVLGYYEDNFYFLPTGSQQLKTLTPSAMASKSNMFSLAPIDHWEKMAGLEAGDRLKSEHWEMHTNGLIQRSYNKGLFNPQKIRGRGAWIDNNRNVLHVGEMIYVDGVEMRPEQVASEFIYPRDLDMGVKYTDPATNAEANKLVQICDKLSWERSLSGPLLAGWCVIAPLCGMLNWRPHVWITGPSGSGKSTVLNEIVSVMSGKFAIKTEGVATEAGIRQKLGLDARPVIMDEAESESKDDMQRMQRILAFARVCASGGEITKGSSSGKAIDYLARAAFCFSSINTNIKHLADEARITKLILKQDLTKSPEYYEDLQVDIHDVIDEDFSNRMLSRSIKYMPVIQENIVVFVKAAVKVFKSRRIADQIGVMLAGTYLCYSTNKISVEDAQKWIEKYDWSEHTIVSAVSDCDRLLSKIATGSVRVSSGHEVFNVSMGEAILIAARADLSHPFDAACDSFHAEIKRNGVMIVGDRVFIANSCDPMRKILEGTPWETSWSRTLGEANDAAKEANKYFSPGIRSRSVSIPVSYFAE